MRSQKGAVSIALLIVTFTITSFVIAGEKAARIEENRRIIQNRASEMEATASKYRQMAEQIKDKDPFKADIYRKKAKELEQAARISVHIADKVHQKERKEMAGPLGVYTPIPNLLKDISELIWEGDKNEYERALAKALSKNTSQSRLYRDVAKARLYSIYVKSGGRFSSSGYPLDEELWAVAINRLRRIYKESMLARDEAFRRAIAEVTGVEEEEESQVGPWIAWYAENIGWQPIWITTKAKFEEEEPLTNYKGGGKDSTIMIKKVKITGPHSSREEANKAVLEKLTNFRKLKGIYEGMPVADYNGKPHNLEHIDCSEKFKE
jgi:hypothetical protein